MKTSFQVIAMTGFIFIMLSGWLALIGVLIISYVLGTRQCKQILWFPAPECS